MGDRCRNLVVRTWEKIGKLDLVSQDFVDEYNGEGVNPINTMDTGILGV